MTYEYTKRCSMSFIISQRKIMNYHYIPIGMAMAKIKQTDHTRVDEGMEQLELTLC